MTFQVFAADCREFDPALVPQIAPAGAVMITDPPYSDHVHNSMTSCAAHGTRKGVRQRDAGFAALTPELWAHIAAIGAQCRWSVVFCDWEGLGGWIQAWTPHTARSRYVRAVPWVRWSMPQMSGDRPPQGSECIALFGTAGAMHWNGPGNLTHFDAACERGDGKHPTAKPLDLMCELVEYFSDPHEFVLDPCAGRGTTILAAKLLGRAAGLGWEWNADNDDPPEEAMRAQDRIAAVAVAAGACGSHSVAGLTSRDCDRWERYLIGREARAKDRERRYAQNQKVIARARAKKAAQPK